MDTLFIVKVKIITLIEWPYTPTYVEYWAYNGYHILSTQSNLLTKLVFCYPEPH